MLAAMRGRLPAVDALIVGSGVYDVERQKQQERRLGVAEVSPLSAANGFTRENFRRYSPQLLDYLPENFPPTLLIHGEDDDVTPLENSKDFYRILEDKSKGVGRSEGLSGALTRRRPFPMHQLEILEETGHQDVVTNTCLGKGRAQAAILDWIAATVGQ
jgi:pimeloyl-ACP methyl ester carboxylesterase